MVWSGGKVCSLLGCVVETKVQKHWPFCTWLFGAVHLPSSEVRVWARRPCKGCPSGCRSCLGGHKADCEESRPGQLPTNATRCWIPFVEYVLLKWGMSDTYVYMYRCTHQWSVYFEKCKARRDCVLHWCPAHQASERRIRSRPTVLVSCSSNHLGLTLQGWRPGLSGSGVVSGKSCSFKTTEVILISVQETGFSFFQSPSSNSLLFCVTK